MSNAIASDTEIITADELLRLPSGTHRYELVEGRLMVREPAGGTHGRLAIRITVPLANHVERQRLGEVFAAETGYRLRSNPDTVRAPDVSYISRERIGEMGSLEGFIPGPPDLAVEVISPGDSLMEVEAKVFDWLAAGTRLVLTVNPRTRSITAYRSRTDIRVHLAHEGLDASDVVPGWRIALTEVFD